MPTLEEIEAMGFAPEDYESDPVDVWPDCWASVEIFIVLGTQWRVGMQGPTGLDYNVLFRLMDQRGLTGEEWGQTLDDVRVMESLALEQMRK